jgi:hypothetical protein
MRPCFACPSGFSLDLYLEAVGFFDREPMMAYEFLGEVDEWLVYRRSAEFREMNFEFNRLMD